MERRKFLRWLGLGSIGSASVSTIEMMNDCSDNFGEEANVVVMSEKWYNKDEY